MLQNLAPGLSSNLTDDVATIQKEAIEYLNAVRQGLRESF